MRRQSRAGSLASLILLAAVLLTSCASGSPSGDGEQATASSPRPLGDARFYVDPAGNAVQAVERLRAAGERDRAALVERRIASRPSATWLATDPDQVFAQAQRVTKAAAVDGSMPVLVAYNVPRRDCGLYSSGGASDIDEYLGWIGSLAAGIGGRPAVVVLEPDAVPHGLDGCVPAAEVGERYRMLAEAVTILGRQPEVHVYLDAGNASWVEDLDELATALRASGVEQADGFALNVSNFETTERSVAYGRRLSALLDDAHFVVDTSRNGAGPPEKAADGDGEQGSWCNPPGRRLGTPPTTSTGADLVDALLWVKQPGDSDGTCRPDAPEAGAWWPAYASELLGVR